MRLALIEARKSQNLTQIQLGEMVGLTRQAVSSLERGRMNGSEYTWKALAEALKSKPEILWRLSEQEPTQ